MTKPIDRDPLYSKRAFDAAIIELCVRWYISYRLSYRDLVEMMAERGVKVAHLEGARQSEAGLGQHWPYTRRRVKGVNTTGPDSQESRVRS
jgi:hypothetical protein